MNTTTITPKRATAARENRRRMYRRKVTINDASRLLPRVEVLSKGIDVYAGGLAACIHDIFVLLVTLYP
jgi:hypothetical protein